MTDELSRIRELALAARELDADPAFVEACARARRIWVDELVRDVNCTPLRRDELIAQIRALEMLPSMLKTIMNDQTMARGTRRA
jgi:hypothetical protein